MNTSISASNHFNDNWADYQEAVTGNTLYHREMSATLRAFIKEKFGSTPIVFVDAGCGDCSTVVPVLSEIVLTQFIGIDGAPDVLRLAEENCGPLNCNKSFICASMLDAISDLPSAADIIYTSYAAHHLTYEEKIRFIQACQDKLNTNGCLIMVDGILNDNQTRDEWLDELESRMRKTTTASEEEIKLRMEHPRADDFPESLRTFKDIAQTQGWQDFSVLFHQEIYAFMVFAK